MQKILYLIFAVSVIANVANAEPPAGLPEAVRKAANKSAPRLVRIETIGGFEKVADELTNEGVTTGLLLDSDGYIITSTFNFLHEPSSILVRFADGKRKVAKKIASDSNRMLTLLKVEKFEPGFELPELVTMPKKDVKPGQWAIALGCALAEDEPNVSLGIISGKDRIWGKAIQTDAKVSPNNYGGPLLDIQGRVIGILAPLSAMSSEITAGAETYDGGVGLAVPMEDIFSVLERLKAGKDVKPGFLGAAISPSKLFTGEPIIEEVHKNSPADKEGLKKGDRIVKINGESVETALRTVTLVRSNNAGDTLDITLLRNGKELNFSVKLADPEDMKIDEDMP
ncbi:MAG: S1C family serine protease [Thermoguttaceae bacterium]